MTSVQSFFKNNLHKSMLPTQNYNLNSQSPLQMRRSVMDPRMTQTEIKSNNISYKYERVGNIFKLVEAKNQIKSNKSNKSNNSDPKQQTIQQNYQIQKINDALQELTNRIISLELQQAKIPGFERKLNEGLIQINSYESLNQHFYDKIKNVSKQILDIKQRLEQVEEHGGSYQTHFKNIYNQITETKENNVYVEKKFQYMHQKLMSEIHNQITTMKNKLSTHQNNPQKNQKKQQKQLLIKKIKSSDMKPKVYVLKYRQTYQYQQSVYSVNEIKYLVDREGRLLDSSGYVILDSNNKQIKLNEKHLLKLNDFGILA